MLQSERLRNEARVHKEAAMGCYKAGRLGRAKDKAYVVSYFFPELLGLRRLNAVLQVLIGYEKKINGRCSIIQKHYRKLFLDMTMDDGKSLGGTYKANKILSHSWKLLCNEKGKKLYDERCRYELRLREQQLRSSLFVPVVLSAPTPHAFRVSGEETKRKASSSTTVPHVKKGRKNSEDAPKNCL
ncbi:hypothetical protein Bca4012_027033 [Brassica carinata]|uniref:Uncharacterized protein n=1 Tax=Brassica carinata TaxID=52824 RepID=A0A8X7VJG4_BRACI|nr:hypothetical protein Bca52824_024042 [Brassica carinata]